MRMGKPAVPTQSAYTRPFADSCGKLARLCAWLGLAACVAIGICGGLTNSAHAQTQATTLPLLIPSAAAFDAQGNLYFAETGNHLMRKVTAGGVITTVAGNGAQGFAGDNGPATAAELDSPAGVALDAAGDLYIADSHNQRVREVAAATGTITTIAGTGVAGYSGDGGAATAARLICLPRWRWMQREIYTWRIPGTTVCGGLRRDGLDHDGCGNGVEGYAGDGGAATAANLDSPNGLVLMRRETCTSRTRRMGECVG